FTLSATTRPPPRSPLFPYTTLFRSVYGEGATAGATRPGELVDRFLARLIDGVLILVVVGIIVVPLTIGMFFAGSDFLGEEHANRSEEHTSELQSRENLVCRLLLEKK